MASDVQAQLEQYGKDTRTFRVLVPELTVHKAVGELRDPINNVLLGVQQGLGKTYFEDEVISAQDISPLLLRAYDDENHPSHDYVRGQIEEDDGDPNENTLVRLGVPFAGYDDMSEDEILAAMQHLPSASIAAIKDYEAAHENRGRLVNYNVGYGESAIDRQEGRVSSELAETDTSKPAAAIRTREVVDDAVIEPGEGQTGTGEPAIAPGTAAAADTSGDEGAKKKVVRRSRKSRASSSSEGTGSDEGTGSEQPSE